MAAGCRVLARTALVAFAASLVLLRFVKPTFRDDLSSGARMSSIHRGTSLNAVTSPRWTSAIRPSMLHRASIVEPQSPMSKLKSSRMQSCSDVLRVNADASSDEKYVVDRNYNVVITGSTKGVGYALAEKFLEEGDSVVICSNEPQSVHDEVVAELGSRFGADKVRGVPCDVGVAADFDNLVEYTQKELGDIDIWINNAGGNLYRYGPLFEMEDRIIQATVDVNLVGTLYGCKRAINVMRDQPRGGHIFNMLGQGQDGAPTANVSVYGCSKRGLEQLNKSLRKELKVADIDNVGIHLMSPGIVKTDLLMADKTIKVDKVKKFIINCLAEPAPDVAEELVRGARLVPIKYEQEGMDGQKVPFLTPDKVLGKFAARVFTGKNRGRWVEEETYLPFTNF
mmetsp:Transcript_21963/g.32730  ORF Transcript_21963/g.32730 Transcript_21963/m.32730 type:complete len:396 (+) Transcript_21963:19-1206(+)